MRGIILTIFIAGMIIILFKALNIKLNMQIGYPREERFRSSNRLSKLQDKINQTVLEQELRGLKNKKKT